MEQGATVAANVEAQTKNFELLHEGRLGERTHAAMSDAIVAKIEFAQTDELRRCRERACPGIAEADATEIQSFEIADKWRRRQNAHALIAEVVVGKIEERNAPQSTALGQIVGLVARPGEMHHLDWRL